MKNTARLIKETRIKAGISQNELGKKCRYRSGQAISNIERGKAPVPFKMLKAISKYVDQDRLRSSLDDDAFEANDLLLQRIYK